MKRTVKQDPSIINHLNFLFSFIVLKEYLKYSFKQTFVSSEGIISTKKNEHTNANIYKIVVSKNGIYAFRL